MRGKLFFAVALFCVMRITPADAGKTAFNPVHKRTGEDHPRGCGENSLQSWTNCRQKGSPPRMRGKLGRVKLAAAILRITPADAGKTQGH